MNDFSFAEGDWFVIIHEPCNSVVGARAASYGTPDLKYIACPYCDGPQEQTDFRVIREKSDD